MTRRRKSKSRSRQRKRDVIPDKRSNFKRQKNAFELNLRTDPTRPLPNVRSVVRVSKTELRKNVKSRGVFYDKLIPVALESTVCDGERRRSRRAYFSAGKPRSSGGSSKRVRQRDRFSVSEKCRRK